MQDLVNNLIKPDNLLNINNLQGIKELMRLMNRRGFKVYNIKAQGYFYTTVAGANLEVSADSRAHLKPRNRTEGLLVACLKVYLATEQDWDLLSSALGLNYRELITKAQKNGNK